MRTQDVIGGNAPLAGRTIEMSADTYFFILDDDDLGRHGQDTDGYGFTVDPSPFTLSLEVSYEGNISLNEYWKLSKNAPDCTFVELMQSAAIAAGRVLTYNDEGGTLAIEEQYVGGTFVLGDVISVDEVTRNVDAWGGDTQKVVIGFDSEDYVTRPITKDYGIDNGNIDGTKDVKAMFSEGNAGTFVGDGNNVIIRDWNIEGDEPELTATKWTIARSGSSKLRRIGFINDMTTTRTIAEQSTCVKVKAFVSLDDFMSVGKHSLVIARGCQYVWTSAEWSNGIATMTLQKA